MFQSWGLLTFSMTIILRLQKEDDGKNMMEKNFLISKNETLFGAVLPTLKCSVPQQGKADCFNVFKQNHLHGE